MDHSLSSVIFEHACKYEFKNTVSHILGKEHLVSQLLPDNTSLEKNHVKPIFMFVYLLKKLHSSDLLAKVDSMPEKSSQVLPIFIELLETTFRQCNFISLKKYFTLTSELKLLDLLSLIIRNLDSSQVLQKLNQHFPRWTAVYKITMEKDFNIDNTKVLEKVEESHAQCRRLILKLAVDLSYRCKYMSEQYASDIERIVKESRCYIKECIDVLQSCVGPSLLEKMMENEENFSEMNDLGTQLLFEYIQPKVTDDGLIRFLDEFEPTLNSEPTSGLTSCLLPFDSMSEDEESDSSDSDYELSQPKKSPEAKCEEFFEC